MPNEKELLALIAKGDEIAFSKLFFQFKDRIYSIAFKLTKSTIAAEEIVQEVFLKIWLKRASLTEIENFSAYLFIIARNDVYKGLKQIAQHHAPTSLSVDSHSFVNNNNTADYLMEKEHCQVLHMAIDRLPNQQRQVYQLVRDQGLKRNEVAIQLNLRPETVKFHLAQAMKNIRTFYMQYFMVFLAFLHFQEM